MIEKSYDVYYELLSDFLNKYRIKNIFIFEVEQANNLSFEQYIRKLLTTNDGIIAAITNAFSFEHTTSFHKKYWDTLNSLWILYLYSSINIKPKTNKVKSIW